MRRERKRRNSKRLIKKIYQEIRLRDIQIFKIYKSHENLSQIWNWIKVLKMFLQLEKKIYLQKRVISNLLIVITKIYWVNNLINFQINHLQNFFKESTYLISWKSMIWNVSFQFLKLDQLQSYLKMH